MSDQHTTDSEPIFYPYGYADMEWQVTGWELVPGGEHCMLYYRPPGKHEYPPGNYVGEPGRFPCRAERYQGPFPRPGKTVRPPADYAAVSRLNLIYHVYPNPANDVWLDNVRQLRRRLALFNGRKIVAIATGRGLAAANDVAAAIDWPDVEYLLVPNDRELGEVASFPRLLAAVRSKDPCQATFYAHTKGAANGREDAGTIRRWRDLMYACLLDDPGRVRELLRRFACVGCLKKVHPNTIVFPSHLPWAHWHFSGTYFWFRHDRIFGDPRWSCVPYDYWGAEMWLGGFLEASEAASLYQPRAETDIMWTAYQPAFWADLP